MAQNRKIIKVLKSQPTLEGAGVHLRRAFGFGDTTTTDPFLLLDDFRGDRPEDYLKGFPWHPHRGIETITYVTAGEVDHGDSLGNLGTIAAGDVQWMTAGSGIIHQEMPRGDAQGRMYGFQLWANLPRSQKMMSPRYRDVKSTQIPVVSLENGVIVRVVSGSAGGQVGPVQDIVIDPEYFDISVPAHTRFVQPTKPGHTVITYVFEGQAAFDDPASGRHDNHTLLVFGDGDQVVVSTAEAAVRFLFISGMPLREPVAWRGPIVMNTEAELRLAFEEYRNGTFIK